MIVKCKNCRLRYDFECPLTVENETYDEDDGWDYYYTYGRSKDDEFFCADGEEYTDEEKAYLYKSQL